MLHKRPITLSVALMALLCFGFVFLFFLWLSKLMYKRSNSEKNSSPLIHKDHVSADKRMTHSLEPREDERGNFTGNVILILQGGKMVVGVWFVCCRAGMCSQGNSPCERVKSCRNNMWSCNNMSR